MLHCLIIIIIYHKSVTIELLLLTLCASSKESTLMESPIFSSGEYLVEEDTDNAAETEDGGLDDGGQVDAKPDDDGLDDGGPVDAGLYVLFDELPSYSGLCSTSLALVM